MFTGANRGGLSRCAKSGIRFTGSVIHTTSTASLDLCIQFCANKDNCESVSYNSSSRSCEAHNKRLGASRGNVAGWTSVNIYCLGKLTYVYYKFSLNLTISAFIAEWSLRVIMPV